MPHGRQGVNIPVTTPAGSVPSPAVTLTASSLVNVTAPAATPGLTAGTGNKTVFLILMVNHNRSDIKNSPSAPYINHDGHPATDHQPTTQHLAILLNNAHISWKSYQEGI